MLPNGDVLFAASPHLTNDGMGHAIFPPPTTIFEFHPTTNTYEDVTPSLAGFSLNLHSTFTRMLLLPSGQFLLGNASNQLALYTPNGNPDPAWRPTITNISYNGSVFTLSGTQLNGLSEGANYGDDAQMASNYPLVQLNNGAGNAPFARTFNWTSTGVATGSNVESVQFTLPAAINPGPFLLNVIANGIASPTVLHIQMSPTNSNIVLRVDPNSPGNVQVLRNGSVLLGEFSLSSFSSVFVSGDPGMDTLTVDFRYGNPLPAGGLHYDGGGNGGTHTLNVNDQANTAASQTYTLANFSVTRPGAAAITFERLTSVAVNGGTGNNTYNVTGNSIPTMLSTGNGSDVVNVENTSPNPLTIDEGTGGVTVNISPTARNLNNIRGFVHVNGASAGADNLVINDQNDTLAQTFTFQANAVSRTGAGTVDFNNLLNNVTVNGGSGANTYNINATNSFAVTTLNTGGGNDTINVENIATSRTVNVHETGSGNDTVNVSPTARNLNNLAGMLNVTGNSGTDTLVLNDQNYATGQTYTLAATALTRTGWSGVVNFGTAMNDVTVNGGSGANTYVVNATGALTRTTINTGNGNDAVNVAATTRPLTINQGVGGGIINVSPSDHNLANILGAITANGGTAGLDVLNVNDQANAANTTYTLTATSVMRPRTGGVFYNNLLNNIAVDGGSGTNSYTVTGTGAVNATTLNTGDGVNDTIDVEAINNSRSLTVNEGAGGDAVNVSPASQDLNTIQGFLVVNGGAGVNPLTINDQNNSASQTYTMTGASVTRTGSAGILFGTLMDSVTLNGGAGADTYNVTGTGGISATTLIDGAGNNTVNIQGTSAVGLSVSTGSGDTVNIASTLHTLDAIGGVTVNDATGTGAVNVDDSGFAGSEDYLVTNTTVTVGRSAVFGLTYNGSAVLVLNGGSSSDIFDLDSTSAATTVNAGTGGNCFHVSPFTQYLAASIMGPVTLNGGGADILDFFDANDPNSETFNFDSIPSSLTLGSTGATIANFSGMGAIYVVTNGFSTANDQSGTVIFDPAGGPPCGPGGAGSSPGTPANGRSVDASEAGWASVDGTLRPGPARLAALPVAATLHARSVPQSPNPFALLDRVFSLEG
jgi:hypothetical protein